MFQNNLTKTTIGIGKKRGGLYYLEGTREVQPKSDRILQVTREMFKREKILLWHCQLGHPSFPYLERSFPHLIKELFKFLVYSVNNAFILKIIVCLSK